MNEGIFGNLIWHLVLNLSFYQSLTTIIILMYPFYKRLMYKLFPEYRFCYTLRDLSGQFIFFLGYSFTRFLNSPVRWSLLCLYHLFV